MKRYDLYFDDDDDNIILGIREFPKGRFVKYSDAIDKATSMYKMGKEAAELKYEQKCLECRGTGQKPEASDDEAFDVYYENESTPNTYDGWKACWDAALKHARQSQECQDALLDEAVDMVRTLIGSIVDILEERHGGLYKLDESVLTTIETDALQIRKDACDYIRNRETSGRED